MAEQMKSITDARQNLPNLSQCADEHMDRFVITNQGRPQSVLLGYIDYQQMKAATELSRRPDMVADISIGFDQLARGEVLTAAEVMERLFPGVAEGHHVDLTAVAKSNARLGVDGLADNASKSLARRDKPSNGTSKRNKAQAV
jgi:PHD/YefM family antitoxin component YafN of YafNO toxin-antitoxin module